MTAKWTAEQIAKNLNRDDFGNHNPDMLIEEIEAAILAEREECAKICNPHPDATELVKMVLQDRAYAIRHR